MSFLAREDGREPALSGGVNSVQLTRPHNLLEPVVGSGHEHLQCVVVGGRRDAFSQRAFSDTPECGDLTGQLGGSSGQRAGTTKAMEGGLFSAGEALSEEECLMSVGGPAARPVWWGVG